MENGQIMFDKQRDVDQTGFSEKKLDKYIELPANQWIDLRKGKTQHIQKSVSKGQKKKDDVLKQLEEHTRKYQQFIQEYVSREEYVSKDAERMLQKIFTLQAIIKNLLHSLKRFSSTTLPMDR